MKQVEPLNPTSLSWRCDPQQFDFETTADVEDLEEVLGQARALDALHFGIRIRREGFNLYVLGPPGLGKRTAVKQFLTQKSADEPTPADWCYVNNFQEPHRPRALQLPAGQGIKFREDMTGLVEELRTAIPAALEIEEHRNRLQEIEEEAKERHSKVFEELAERAEKQGIKLVRTPGGFALAPVREGEVLSPEEFEQLPEEVQKEIQETITALQQELQDIIEKVPQWSKETRERIKELNREATMFATRHLLIPLREKYREQPDVIEYLDGCESDVVEHSDQFHPREETPAVMLGLVGADRVSFKRFQVNLLVDNSETNGAPVIYEDHPNYQNLLGRVEHHSQMGSLITDFTLIKPGALHRASGGYLVLDALRMLLQPYAWEGLKRALHSSRIKIESLGEALSLVSTVSLEPEPIPLDTKVVLLGDRLLYYLLYQYDADFPELFKVAADFDDRIDRSPENCKLYARFVATLARKEKQRPLDRGAVARVVEHSARVAGDSERLTARMRAVADLLRETDYWAGQDHAEVATAAHVDRAIEKQIHRADRLRHRVHEEIQRGTILIDTEQSKVGQVNGLSVIDLGNFSFGQPSRITATARLGKGEVVDIEREVELGGPIHSKGVLILSSFLAARYTCEQPLSLSASLVFEQSYGMVEGDSASVGELCALMSVLSGVPIKQSLAVTGSINQHGQVQPIGGANEKIEGFFDVCRQRELRGDQGVLIPAANVKHLMLRRDVVEAAEAGRFHIYAVETIDEAVGLLTGVLAGEPDEQGRYPEGSVNQRVAARLREFAEMRLKFSEKQQRDASHE